MNSRTNICSHASALAAVTVFGAAAMVAQTLLLRRFLWRFESAETGVALFLSCWLLWAGVGAAVAATPFGHRLTGLLSRFVWVLIAVCAALYFAQYALIENLRGWLGVPEYQTFPLAHLALGCLLANAPFCCVAGIVIPSASRRFEQLGIPVSRAFAWEALGAASGGLGVTVMILFGVPPDPRDVTEWFRYFPQATERPGRFETGGGTTFYGSHGGTFYALSSGGVSEVIPEGDRAMELAALVLSQRPYAKEVLLVGQVPLAAGLALEALRPDLSIVWCPCDAPYGAKLLGVIRAGGFQTGVRAAGQPPQPFMDGRPEASFDVVLAALPPATSLEGAGWRGAEFANRVRRVTRRTGVALFSLDCEAAALTTEKAALLDVTVRGVRQAWPESGVFAPGAGGWWIAAQVPGLAYEADSAATRFAMLKRDLFSEEAVARLYDPVRAQQWAQQVPVLNAAETLVLPEPVRAEVVLATGIADAVRRGYPETAPGAWLIWLRAQDGVRLGGLLLVALWMVPVALGGGAHARRRLLAAWLAACGALGLVVSLAVLYRLQMRFGTLYLLAGVGSGLYLTGLFCGNRLGEGLLKMVFSVRGECPDGHTTSGHAQGECPDGHTTNGHAREECPDGHTTNGHAQGECPDGHTTSGHARGECPDGHTTNGASKDACVGCDGVRRFSAAAGMAGPRRVRWLLVAFTLVQAGCAFGVLAGAEWAVTTTGVVLLCFLAGSAAGLTVPTALAACEGSRAEGAAVFVLADALGAAVAGLFFVVLVPLAGLWETVMCFAALACGMALCAALGGSHARLTAGLALAATLAVLGGKARDAWPERLSTGHDEAAEEVLPSEAQATNQTVTAGEKTAVQLRGIPRKVDADRIRELMRDRRLSTHAAEFLDGK